MCSVLATPVCPHPAVLDVVLGLEAGGVGQGGPGCPQGFHLHTLLMEAVVLSSKPFSSSSGCFPVSQACSAGMSPVGRGFGVPLSCSVVLHTGVLPFIVLWIPLVIW